MADGAREVRDELDQATGAANGGTVAPTQRQVTVQKNGAPTTYDLIYEGSGSPWTADALRAAWLDEPHDIAFLGAHFSDNAALAADTQTILTPQDLAAASADLSGTIILGQGCHLGYNLVDPDGFFDANHQPLLPTLDWAQAAAQRHVGALVAGVGFQFGAGPDAANGDTGDIVEYGEREYVDIAKQLRARAPGTVAIGAAFVEGKRDYLAVVGSYMDALHEKQIAETTLFGFPMLGVKLAGTPPTTGTVQTVAPDTSGNIKIDFPAADPNRALQWHGGFYTGPFGMLGVPGTPILPVDLADASRTGTGGTQLVLRGLGFRGGTYSDTDAHRAVDTFRPTISSPVTDQNATLTRAYRSPIFYPTPARVATVNY